MALIPDIVRSSKDLQEILQLQQQNLKQHLSSDEKSAEGFLTLEHTLLILEAMHKIAPSIVIRDGEKIVAYALTETIECRQLMPQLEPMFALIDTLSWQGKPINQQRYYTMGQICVAKEYRGMGLTDKLYLHHKKVFRSRFDLFITEISTSNPRSIRAHERIGFVPINTHRDELDEWVMVLWDFNS